MTDLRPAVLAIALLGATYLLPLPGVDQAAAHAALGRVSAWWASQVGVWPPAFSLLSGGLLGLVAARFAQDLVLGPWMAPSARPIWRALFAGLYLAGSGVSGLAIGLTLDHRLPELAPLGAVVTGTLTAAGSVAAAALVWSLAALFRSSGLGNGAAALFLVAEFVRAGRYYAEWIAGVAAGEPDLGWLPLSGPLVPLGLVCLLLWRWTPDFPRDVARGLHARGATDLLALPLILGALGGTLAADLAGWPSWFPQSPLYDPGLVARAVGTLLAVPALGFWVARQPGKPGSPWWLGFGLLALAATLGLLVVGR